MTAVCLSLRSWLLCLCDPDWLLLSPILTLLTGLLPFTTRDSFYWLSYWLLLAELSWALFTTDGQPASLSWNKAHIWGLRPDFYYLCDSYGIVLVGRPLWREDGSVFYICCWLLPAQSFFGPSPLGLMTIFYCLTFETSLFVASYDSQGHGGGIRSRLHTGICSSYILHRRTVYRTPRSTLPLWVQRVNCYVRTSVATSWPSIR
jgi:hypothetical protein